MSVIRPISLKPRPRAAQAGYSLMELMVSLTLGLIILSGLITVFVNSSRTSTEFERANQQIENGRYAMQLLSEDLANAGYLAELDPGLLPTPASAPNPCSVVIADLKLALPLALQGYPFDATVPSCLSDVRSGSDILVVRRASTCMIGESGCDTQASGIVYFQASSCGSTTELGSASIDNHYALDNDLSKLTMHQKDCSTLAGYRQFRTHIYFVANNDKSGDGIPTLKRAELSAGSFTIVPLVEGVENLHLEYGIDIPSNTSSASSASSSASSASSSAPPALSGAPAVFTTDPGSYAACVGVVCTTYWRNVVAVKVNLLARNVSTSTGYTDSKTYSLGTKKDGTENILGPYNDGYKRHAYGSVVRVNNPASRNTP